MAIMISWYKTAYTSLSSIYLHLKALYVRKFTQQKTKNSSAKTVVMYAESPFALFCVNVFRNYKAALGVLYFKDIHL